MQRSVSRFDNRIYLQVGYDSGDGANYYQHRSDLGEVVSSVVIGYNGRPVHRTYSTKGTMNVRDCSSEHVFL